MEGLSKIKLFLFDMDGTIYLGEKLFEFTAPLLKEIKRQGKHYLFITNNSSKRAYDYVTHLVKLGIRTEVSDFITSGEVTAQYLKENYKDAIIYAAGTRSFKNGLLHAGLKITDSYSPNIEVVVNAYDTELTYEKLDIMSRILTEKKQIPYIATNPDMVCPTEYGYVPDCGSVSEMLFNATGRRPHFIGKPEPEMIFSAMKRYSLTGEQTLVIGDRLYTDIASGINAGTKTLLVLSGETTLEQVKNSSQKPDFIMNSCEKLLEELKELEV